jgi:phytoene dehydrogenase-like protein
MKAQYDVVVVGSGHNGLIAGAFLAKAGKKVLILERNEFLGGGVVTSEIAAPGYLHDWHSALHVLIQANPLLRSDELGLISQFGLSYVYPDAIVSTVFDDGDHLTTYTDIDRTCAGIARISPEDADAYRSFAGRSAALLPLMLQGMFVPPVPQGAFWALLDQSPEGRGLMHVMQKSMLEIVDEHFRHEKVKIHLMKCAAELLIGPDEKGTGAFIFNMAGFAHSFPWGIPIGGSRALVDSLVRCLRAYGAEIRMSAEVKRIRTTSGKTAGVRLADGEEIDASVVIGQIHPWLLGDLVESLDPLVARGARQTKTSAFSLITSMYALREAPRFEVPPEASRVGLMNLAPASLEAYLKVFDDLRYGDMPRSPVMAIHDHAQWDPSRAPAGGGTLTVCTFCPCTPRGQDISAWQAKKPEVEAYIRERARLICTSLGEENIAGHVCLTPLDAVRHSPTFQNGDVGGIGKSFYQIGGHRPTPELAQYAVPGAQGLYLAGTFMHPPGGVTGGGRATAIKICDDLGIDFDGLCGQVS